MEQSIYKNELIGGEFNLRKIGDENLRINRIGDNDIRENGVGMLTVVTEYTHDTEVFFCFSAALKVNDRPAIIIVDVTVPGTSTDGTGFQLRPKACHEGVKNRF